jgi:hypothetical protein
MARTLAIVERLPGHTEVMGAFASLAQKLGYEPHLFFESRDPFHMVDYFRTRLSLGAGQIHEWSEITNLAPQFEVILLNTSNVWLDYGPWLEQWDALERLIVVHHHPEDIELNPYGAPVYLTPAAGEEKWIFPLYCQPSTPLESGRENALRRGATDLPPLTCIGALEGKDIAGASAYLQTGGRLVHYERYRRDNFSAHPGLYALRVGLGGMQFMAALAQEPKPTFIWLPILPNSDYMMCRLTGALTLGVDLNGIMVMPERLRQLYGFPEPAVITYDTSITEPACLEKLRASPMQQEERRRQLHRWAAERWKKNLEVFQTLLEFRK